MYKSKVFLILFALLSFFPVNNVLAANIEQLSATPIAGDYVVGPGKTEIRLDPGAKTDRSITVTNRYGKDMLFKITVEDFKGSSNPKEVLILLGEEKGPYSLRDYIHPELTEFKLHHGERITLPISIQIPVDAQPEGLYGSVIITSEPIINKGDTSLNSTTGNVTIISRIASLFFVRVNGQAIEQGGLKDFIADKKYYSKPDINLKFLYENTGNVYLNPYGLLRVQNIIGTTVEEIRIEPYFVMPQAVRQKDLSINKKIMFGRYKAILQLNRGYQDIIDEKAIYFWVLPWKIIVGLLLAVIAVSLLARVLINWFSKNFEVKRKV